MTLPVSLDPVLAETRWRGRRQRFLALALILLAVVLTLGLRSSGGGPSIRYPTTASSVRAYELDVGVPRGFHRYLVRGGMSPTGARPPVIGVTLANWRVSPHAELRTSNVLPLHTRTKGVVLQVGLWFQIGVGQPDRLHLPLSLDQKWWHEDVATGTLRWGLAHFRGQDYAIRVWLGRTVSTGDRAALQRALASVRPAR